MITTASDAGPSWPAPWPALAAIDALLRTPDRVLDRIDAGQDLPGLARAYIATMVLGTAVLGATLGSYRGGAQILFAAAKLPLVAVLTAVLVTPAFVAVRRAVHGAVDPRRDAVRVLACLALAALLTSATAPLLLLLMSLGLDYHACTLSAVACCGLGGLGGGALAVRVVSRDPAPGRRWQLAILVVVASLSGAQLAWTLRPYLVRPRAIDVPFVRDLEGSFFEAVAQSLDSARGRFHRDAAPLPEGTPPAWHR